MDNNYNAATSLTWKVPAQRRLLLSWPASGYETDLDLKGKKVVAVLSGGNIDAELLYRIMKARMSGSSDASV